MSAVAVILAVLFAFVIGWILGAAMARASEAMAWFDGYHCGHLDGLDQSGHVAEQRRAAREGRQ